MNRSMHDPMVSAEYASANPEMLILMAMAREILAASQEQEWQHVGGLVVNWRGALNRFFENDSNVVKDVCRLDDIRRLNEINCQVIALVEEYRESLTVQLKGLRRGRKAVSAYGASHAR